MSRQTVGGKARDRVLLLAVLVALIACFVPPAGAAPTTPGWVFGFSSEGTIYDGNSHVGFGPSSDGMAAAGALQSGTIQITFTPDGVVGTQTLAHFSNGTNSSQEAHLSLEGSSLRWRLTGPTQTLTDVTVPVAIVPNVQHQIHLGVERGLLWIHLDGSPVYLGQSSAFLSSIGGMNNIHVGARRVSGNPVLWLDGFKGRIERLSVLNGMMPLPLMRKENRGNRAPGQNWHPVSLPDFVNLTPHLAPNRQTPTRWVVTGDSITQGAPHTYGYRSWSQQLQARLAELGNSSDIVINTAASGSTAASLTGSAFADRVGRYRPDVVLAMVGMDDAATGSGRDLAAYRADLNALITSTRDTGAIPILLTSNPVGPGATTREQLPAYMQALREVAAQRQVIVVDAYGDWLYTNSGAAPASWYADALHPNAHGHWQLARVFLEQFEGGWSTGSGIGADVVPGGGRRDGGAPTVSTGNPEQAYGWRFHPPANVFNDTRGDENHSAFLTGRPAEGSYFVRFSTTQRTAGALMSITDTSRSDSRLVISSVDGGVRADIVNRGRALVSLSSGDMGLADGSEHTVALVAGDGSTRLFVDSVLVDVVARQAFSGDVENGGRVTIGAVTDSTGRHTRFTGTIARTWAWDAVATPHMFLQASGLNISQQSADYASARTRMQLRDTTSGPLYILGGSELTGQNGGWRTWPQILTERHRWERGNVGDHVITMTPAATSLPARISWFAEQMPDPLAPGGASPLVLVQGVASDVAAAGGAAAYETQLKDAISALRARNATPILMTSLEAERTAPEVNAAIRRAAATASTRPAVLIDVAAHMRATNSGAVPASWFRTAGGLSAAGHQRVAFKLQTDLGIWSSASDSANSVVRLPAAVSLAVPSAVTAIPGGVAQINVQSTVTGAAADDPVIAAHVLGGAAAMEGITMPGRTGQVNGSTGIVGSPGVGVVAAGGTFSGAVNVRIPADAKVGDTFKVAVNTSVANPTARVPGRVATITVVDPQIASLDGLIWLDERTPDGVRQLDEPAVGGGAVTVLHPDGSTTSHTSGADGRWSLTGLPYGTYTVTYAEMPALSAATSQVQITLTREQPTGTHLQPLRLAGAPVATPTAPVRFGAGI